MRRFYFHNLTCWNYYSSIAGLGPRVRHIFRQTKNELIQVNGPTAAQQFNGKYSISSCFYTTKISSPKTVNDLSDHKTLSLDNSIKSATNTILRDQHPHGFWHYGVQDVVYGTATHVITLHCLGETIEPTTKQGMIRYIKRRQLRSGGWSLAPGEPMDLNYSVLAYLALKILGEDPNEKCMAKACRAISEDARVINLDLKFRLTLCGIYPWKYLPIMPVETLLLPSWFPINLFKMASWTRCFYVPFLAIRALEPKPPLNSVNLDELNLKVQTRPKRAQHQSFWWFSLFSFGDKIMRVIYPLTKPVRRKMEQVAIERAIELISLIEERANNDGLDGIAPPTQFALIMFRCLGLPDHPAVRKLRAGLDSMMVELNEEVRVDVCRSHVWDTCWAGLSLLEASGPGTRGSMALAADWLKSKQIFAKGDWSLTRPNLRPGGWAFQLDNSHYPDVDDTAVAAIFCQQVGLLHKTHKYENCVQHATEWIIGMETQGGGWGAFDADNTSFYLNSLPFVDHVGLLDPPTVDVTARCLSMLARVGDSSEQTKHVIKRSISFILKHQEANRSWYGRWGVNYIYGTWSALCALKAAGVANEEPCIQRAISWILSNQNEDGGWGESTLSYNLEHPGYVGAESSASQTAWALLGLIACDCLDHETTLNGINYLLRTQQNDGLWNETAYTGTGHPGIMMLKYHGYPKYFPLIALARYRNMKQGNLSVRTGL